MIRNISLGIYFPGKSILHRLQARTKLLVIFWLVIFLTIANQREWHFAPYLVVGTLLVAAIALSSISFRECGSACGFLYCSRFSAQLPTFSFPQAAVTRCFTHSVPSSFPTRCSIGLLSYTVCS